MKRSQFFGLLAGALASTVVAVPAFAEESSGKRPAIAGANANHGAASEGRGKRSEAAGERANHGDAAKARRHAVQGALTKVEGTAPALTLTLETKHAGPFLVTTNADTEFRGKDHDDLTLAGLKDPKMIGARIIAQGTRDGNKFIAKHVIVRPAKKDHDDKDDKGEAAKRTITVGVIGGLPASGAITGFTVTPQGAAAVTFVANADTEYSLKGTVLTNGLTVRVASKKDGPSNVALKVRVPA